MKVSVPRWRGAVAAASFAFAAGVASGSFELLTVAVLPLSYAILGYSGEAPAFELEVTRTLDDDSPSPGQVVEVMVTVENRSTGHRPDVRIYDEPPDGATVVEGSPAFATALKDGGSYSNSYKIRVPRGEHGFGEVTVELSNLPRTKVTTLEFPPSGDVSLDCETHLDYVPFTGQTTVSVGDVPTGDGGEGMEFHSTREYRRGDPVSKIDWRGFARTGEPSTVVHREQRSVTAVFVVDDRSQAHYATRGDGLDSLDLTLYAAARGVQASIENGNSTAVTSVGGQWVPPGSTSAFAERAVRVVESMEAGSTASLSDADLIQGLASRLPVGSQTVFCTPSIDEDVLEFCRTLKASGHDVTVLSPDTAQAPPSPETAEPQPTSYGAVLESERRRYWIDRLRADGVAVADWSPEEPVTIELARLRERWDR